MVKQRNATELLREVATKTNELPFPQKATQTQTTSHILMVAPLDFQQNVQTIVDNSYMKKTAYTAEYVREQAAAEFMDLYDVLTHAGVTVHLFTQEAKHDTPDACFPNNWFSTHHIETQKANPRTLVLYPMKALNRRLERRADIIGHLQPNYHSMVDLSFFENQEPSQYLEGTGSMVLDRVNRVAYVLISERAHRSAAEFWAKEFGYNLVAFHGVDQQGKPIYHTNVMMAVGTTIAVVCSECVIDPSERQHLLSSLSASHIVIDITYEQVNQFCGNVIELRNDENKSLLAMSTSAYNGFTLQQRALILQHVDDIIHADISLIETLGGGSVRCTIGEIF